MSGSSRPAKRSKKQSSASSTPDKVLQRKCKESMDAILNEGVAPDKPDVQYQEWMANCVAKAKAKDSTLRTKFKL